MPHGVVPSSFMPSAPSSPVEARTVTPLSVAFLKWLSRPCSCAEVAKSSSGVPMLIEMTSARWWETV